MDTRALMVGLGGFVGATARFWVGTWLGQTAFPWATLLVNLVGCFGLACFATWVSERAPVSDALRLLVSTGFFGALTTFSTFALETLSLLEAGKPWQALAYSLGSVLLGLIGTALGMALSRAI
ncbi:MAG: fluoride efflux transporter CrcB [Anaerolineae bacterium]|nr:fluoride efflux transporter CrcB [Anaerolineae bacterium]